MPNRVPYSSSSKCKPAQSSFVWKKDEAVRLRMEKEGVGARTPETVVEAFSRTVEKYPNNIAMIQNVGDSVDVYTYKQYYHNVVYVAKVFIKMGLEPFGGVALMGFNSPQWFISHLASIFAGGLSVGIYATNNADTCKYIMNNSGCNIAVVEDEAQLEKILSIKHLVPTLKSIIVYSGELSKPVKDVYLWPDVFKVETDEESLNRRIKDIYPNQCCCLIYTSGTTGDPKGVMISHDNLTWTVRIALELMNNNQRMPPDVGVSYLPLSHIAGLLLDVYGPIFCGGGSSYFADRDALKGTFFKTMKEAKPTTMFGVPRVWEKVKEKLEAKLESSNIFKKGVIAWAQDLGQVASIDAGQGLEKPFGYELAHSLVFEELRESIGLERCRVTLVGAAVMKKDVSNFFNSIGMPMMDVYGLSECSGPFSFSTPNCYKLGTTGKVMKGMKCKIAPRSQCGVINGCLEGEICLQGRNIFMGYLDREEQTKEVFDKEEYLLSGDLGYLDQDQFLVVNGRIKELIITSGGENIAPLPIEERIIRRFPFLSNCMVIGEKKNYLCVLLTFKVEPDQKTLEPTDFLAKPAVEWLDKMDVEATTVTDALERMNHKARQELDEGIEEVNKAATSRAQTVKKWRFLPKDFSISSGVYGPTMKVKRRVVNEMYKDLISELYAAK